MIELLKRWSELQPSEVDPAELGTTLESLKNDLSSVYPQIQWKVQQAIVAWGWYWELRYWPPKQRHKAEVDDNMSEWLDNPAEALLSAYVKALEAER